MSQNSADIPDAWDDDDWESQADKLASELSNTRTSDQKVSSKASKAQKRAQHAEFNRQLWAEAESPQTFHFLETRSSSVPLKTEFKPAVKVLSRKPQIATRPSQPGDNQADSDEEEEGKQPELTPEEKKAKAQREREEKQRKYEEVRERLFGSSATESGVSTPGSTTPPRHGDKKGKGKGKAHSAGDGRDHSHGRAKRESSTASNKSKQLYDPDSDSRPASSGPQRPRPQQQQQQPQQQHPVRTPRGPDGSGRGGFGFASRGGKAT